MCGDLLKTLARKMCEMERGEGEGGCEDGREGGDIREDCAEGDQDQTETESPSLPLSPTVNSLTLSRLIFAAGHTAQCQVET